MLEPKGSKGRRSVSEKSEKPAKAGKVTLKKLLKEPEIQFFIRFVDRYDLREKALELINAKQLRARAH